MRIELKDEEGKEYSEIQKLSYLFGWNVHQDVDTDDYVLSNTFGKVVLKTKDKDVFEFDMVTLIQEKYVEALTLAFIFFKSRITALLKESKGQKKPCAYIRNNLKEFVNEKEIIPNPIKDMLMNAER